MKPPPLTGRMSNILSFSWRIEESLASKYISPPLKPAIIDGSAWVSLVGVQLSEISTGNRLLDIITPKQWPEINLRIYAEHEGDIGVVFIKGIIPNRNAALAARWFWKEPFEFGKVGFNKNHESGRLAIQYTLNRDDAIHSLRATTKNKSFTSDDLPGAKLREVHFGYASQQSQNIVSRVKLKRPPWRVHEVIAYDLSINSLAIYGDEWSFLQSRNPDLVMLAEGSTFSLDTL